MRALFFLLCTLCLPAQHIEWNRAFGQPRYACGPRTAVIDTAGDLKFTREIPEPGLSDNWAIQRLLVATVNTVSLLSDMLHPRSGKVQYHEGASCTRFNALGEPAPAKTITAKNELLQVAIPGPNGSFFLGADQHPLVIRHFDPNGALCATAQISEGLQLFRLSSTGAVTQRTPIAAEQGTVAGGPAGTCALLAGDANHAVTLSAYIGANQQLWKTATPLSARHGRVYSLHTLPDGYFAIDGQTMAKFSPAGQLEWAKPLPTPRHTDSIAVTGNTVYLLYGLAGDLSFHVLKLTVQ